MAVTRKGYIFSAFLLGLLSVLLILVSTSSDSWIVSTATAQVQNSDSLIQYGLFRGKLELRLLITPTANNLYMTCVPDINACAVSCKTETQARKDEVRALAAGLRPNPTCIAITTVEDDYPLPTPPVISFIFYVFLLLLIFINLIFAVLSAGLAILNATKNPTEPMFGLPGCLICNVLSAILGVTILLMFGIYWAVSGLKEHLAFSYIALDQFDARPGLGFSYWLLVCSSLCSLSNVGLLTLRKYLLERDPPPPVLKVDNHSDGTIFLY